MFLIGEFLDGFLLLRVSIVTRNRSRLPNLLQQKCSSQKIADLNLRVRSRWNILKISSNSSRYRIWKLKLEKFFGRKYIWIFWYAKTSGGLWNWWPNIHPGNEPQNRQSLSPKKRKFHVPTSQASKFQGALLAVSFIGIWCICQLSLKFLRGTLHRTSLEPQPENAVKRGEHRKAPMPRTMAAGTPAVEAPVEAPGEEGWEGLQMPDRIYGTWILRVCTCSQVQWRCLIYTYIFSTL